MAQITSLAKVLNGLVRNYDFTGDELVFDSVRYGGLAGTLLTKTILDSLIANSHASGSDNQNIVAGAALTGGGSGATVTLDVAVDGTTIEVNSDALRLKDGAVSASKLAASAITGQTAETSPDNADMILIYDDSAAALKKMSRSNFLQGAADEKVKVSANDTTAKYLEDAIVSANSLLSVSTLNDGGDEDLQLTVNQGNIDHGSIAGLGDDDHTQYHNDARGDARYYQKSEFVTTSTANAPVKLDAGGKISAAQLPNSVMEYKGTFDPTGPTPALVDGTGNAGDVYRVTVAGSYDFGSGSISFVVGDYAIYNGSIWEKAHSGADAVVSVNGQAGVVVLTTSNISEGSNLYFTDERAQDAIGAMVANSSKVSLTYVDGTPSLTADIVAGSLVNADISASAAIAYSKLALSGSIVNADVSASAAIAYSKLNLSGSIVDADVSASAAIAYSKLNLSNSIVNADISASAAIAYSKLNLSNSIVAGDLTSSSVTLAKLASDSVDENKIVSTAHDSSLSGGSGAKLSVVSAPAMKKTMVAGEAFAADTSFLVRFAVSGETAGRVYKATAANAVADGKFWAIGMAIGTGQSAGGNIDVIPLGTHTLGSSDAAFSAGDIGKAVWLTTAGGFSVTSPSSSGDASFRVGSVETTTKIFIDGKQLTGIN